MSIIGHESRGLRLIAGSALFKLSKAPACQCHYDPPDSIGSSALGSLLIQFKHVRLCWSRTIQPCQGPQVGASCSSAFPAAYHHPYIEGQHEKWSVKAHDCCMLSWKQHPGVTGLALVPCQCQHAFQTALGTWCTYWVAASAQAVRAGGPRTAPQLFRGTPVPLLQWQRRTGTCCGILPLPACLTTFPSHKQSAHAHIP